MEINVELTKKQASLIIHAIYDSINMYDKAIKDFQDDLENYKNGKIQAKEKDVELVKQTISCLLKNTKDLHEIAKMLDEKGGNL